MRELARVIHTQSMAKAGGPKGEWVQYLPSGQPARFTLARLVESDGGRDETENYYYEVASDPDFVRLERAQRRFRSQYLRRVRRLSWRRQG